MGCPIDLVVDKGAGSALMTRPKKITGMVLGLTKFLSCPVTLKMRVGWNENKPVKNPSVPTSFLNANALALRNPKRII